jgi:hypothetical protein
MIDTTQRRSRGLMGFVAGFGVCVVAVVSFHAWQADAFPGELDSTFRGISPCRLVDTRPTSQVGSETTLGADDTRILMAHGSQGECTLPTDAVGLSLNVTAVGATDPTFLTFWPGGTRPKASSLNPAPGQPPTPNAVVTDLVPAGTFQLYNLAGSVDVIIDVNGYYLNWTLRDLDLRLGELEATDFLMEHERTTAAYDGGNSSVLLTTSAGAVASVTVDQATSGRVILNSSATVWGNQTQGDAECSITTSSTVVDGNYRQRAQTYTDRYASISGTRGYIVNKGSIFSPDQQTYNLVCRELGSDTYILDANLSAVFVPDPKVFKKIVPMLP